MSWCKCHIADFFHPSSGDFNQWDFNYHRNHFNGFCSSTTHRTNFTEDSELDKASVCLSLQNFCSVGCSKYLNLEGPLTGLHMFYLFIILRLKFTKSRSLGEEFLKCIQITSGQLEKLPKTWMNEWMNEGIMLLKKYLLDFSRLLLPVVPV